MPRSFGIIFLMGERAQMHQFADRKVDPDALAPHRHLLPAGLVSLALATHGRVAILRDARKSALLQR
jgi:hypothetical protein